LAILAIPGAVKGGEAEALRISQTIVARHLPHGTVLDPVFSPDGRISGYTRCGDSAIWTGHWLAAESFRYAVTRSADALENVNKALGGIGKLVDVTGRNSLARCILPADSPYLDAVLAEESRHGFFAATLDGRQYFGVGQTSRDQFAGVFFGLGVAYDFTGDENVRAVARDLVTRLLSRLIADDWAVVMPDGSTSTVFWHREDQRLSFLSVGRQLNGGRFNDEYKSARFWSAGAMAAPIAVEALDPHGSYFKFNLDYINLFHLVRLEGSSYYRWWFDRAYSALRAATASHGNAHFNMIDRALRGANAGRDAETRELLDEWLKRPAFDEWVEWRGIYAACWEEERACRPIPVAERVRTDFLWQRSPFLLFGGGFGNIESAGIDYILPYWMARYYGVY
jgi:hypothetical protein